MTGTDRIKLAEAMGYKWERKPKSWHLSHVYPDMGHWLCPDGSCVTDRVMEISDCFSACGSECADPLPDPFTDANDDYAVLEWMHKKGNVPNSLFHMRAGNYEVGDYARAALKVIADMEQT